VNRVGLIALPTFPENAESTVNVKTVNCTTHSLCHMAIDGEAPNSPAEDEMLPDEREILSERGEALDEADDDDLLTVDEVAADLGIDLNE